MVVENEKGLRARGQCPVLMLIPNTKLVSESGSGEAAEPSVQGELQAHIDAPLLGEHWHNSAQLEPNPYLSAPDLSTQLNNPRYSPSIQPSGEAVAEIGPMERVLANNQSAAGGGDCSIPQTGDSVTAIACTFFKTALDKWPTPWEGGWEGLCRSFHDLRSPAIHPEGADPKRYLPAICGATFTKGSWRACGNVMSIQLAILDFDNAQEIPDPGGATHASGRPIMIKRRVDAPASMDVVCAELLRRGITAFGWSTWSNTKEWPRFRLVIPFERPVLPDDWPQMTDWLLGAVGLKEWRRCIDMPVLRDTARLHFLPAQRTGGPAVEWREVVGRLMVVPTKEILDRIPKSKPSLQRWQFEAIAKRATFPASSGSAQDRFGWARRFRSAEGQRLDVKTLDALLLLGALGCLVGPGRSSGGGSKYRTTCPWALEHSHQLDDDSGVLFIELGRWPAWHCSHTHHRHLGIGDLLELAGVLR